MDLLRYRLSGNPRLTASKCLSLCPRLRKSHVHPAGVPRAHRCSLELGATENGRGGPSLSPKFEIVINLQTAKLLGIEVPETLLATADELIK
jgi:hypothetical protein